MAVLLFFFVTFASSWLLWMLPDLLAASRSGLLAIGGPVFLLGVFAPGLVALAMTARAEGAAGVTRLLARIGRWEVRWPLYVFAVGYMPLTRLAAAAIARGTTGVSVAMAWLYWKSGGSLLMVMPMHAGPLMARGLRVSLHHAKRSPDDRWRYCLE